MNYFEVKVKYLQQQSDNKLKPVCVTYLIATETFADAEKKALEEIAPFAFAGSTPLIVSIKRVKIDEVQRKKDGAFFYLAKVNMFVFDDHICKEKKSSINILVQSNSIEDANKEVKAVLADSISDWSVDTIKETPIIEVLGIRQEHVDAANNA